MTLTYHIKASAVSQHMSSLCVRGAHLHFQRYSQKHSETEGRGGSSEGLLCLFSFFQSVIEEGEGKSDYTPISVVSFLLLHTVGKGRSLALLL